MSRDPDTIEQEIENTRSRIESRLESLSTDLHPTRIMESALGTADQSPSETFEMIAARARQSPISTALVGAGLVGLFLAGRQKPEVETHETRSATPDTLSDDPAERIGQRASKLQDQFADAGERARYEATLAKMRAGDVVEDAQETLSDAVDTAKAKIGGAVSSARSMFSGGSQSASDYASRTAKVARKAPVRARAQGEVVVDWVRENPVSAGLLALAGGAVASSIFALSKSSAPRSRAAAAHELYEEARHEDPVPVVERAPRSTKKVKAKAVKAKTAARKSAAKSTKASARKSASKTKAAKTTPAETLLGVSDIPASGNLKRSTSILGKPDDKG